MGRYGAGALGRYVGRRAGALLLVCTALTAAALVPASRLRIEADLDSVLPRGTPAAADYRTFLQRFGGLERLFVLVESSGPVDEDGLARAAEALAAELRASPEVARARSGLTEEDERFFLEQVAPSAVVLAAALPGGVQEARRRLAPEVVQERVAWIRAQLLSPAGDLLAPWLTADPLGFSEALWERRAGGLRLPVDPGTGAFLSEDRGAALVTVIPARSEFDPEAGRRLESTLDQAYRRVREATGQEVTFRAAGGPLYAAHDETALRGDLVRTATGSVILVGAILAAGLGGLVVSAVPLLGVLVGGLWAAALAALAAGSLTAVAVGFAAILAGLGVDYSLHGTARYVEYRGAGEPPAAALGEAFRDAGPGVLASAATTAIGFGCLALAHFRPIREMGWFVACGIVLILVAAATAGGGALVLADRRRPRRAGGPLWGPLGRAVEAAVALAGRRPGAVLAAAALLTGVLGGGIPRLELDADPSRLRPVDRPLDETARRLAMRFAVMMDTSTVVVTAPDAEAALQAAAKVRLALEPLLPRGSDVITPADWIASRSAALEAASALQPQTLRQAADVLERSLGEAGFRPEPFRPAVERLRDLARGHWPVGPPLADLPAWLQDGIRQGADGVAVAVRIRADEASFDPEAAMEKLRVQVPGVALASVPRLGRELRRVAIGDLERLGGAALLLVAGTILTTFRGRPGPSVLSLLPATLGVGWTLGIWGWLRLPLDLFCLATLPVLLGIGVDDGLHVLHGARVRPQDGIPGAVRRSGRALALTTLTTCAGFASLGLSRVPGLRNGGALVAVGMAACLLATVLVLPALAVALAAEGRPSRPPHAPHAGAARRLLGRFHVTGVFWYQLHRFAVTAVPRWAVAPWILLFTSFFFVALRRIRRAIAGNLEVALGPCGWWERQARIFRTMWRFAWCLTERYEQRAAGHHPATRLDGEAHWRAATEAGQGLLLVTAHLGNWESGAFISDEGRGRNIHLVREPEADPRAQQFVARHLREGVPENVEVHFAHDEPGLALRLREALGRGEVVALQGDRPRATGRSLEVPLFGRTMWLPEGPAALARAAGVPMLPVFVLREGRSRYRVEVRPPIPVRRTADRQTDLRLGLQRLASELEGAIRREPHQWFCFAELWPPKHGGEAGRAVPS